MTERSTSIDLAPLYRALIQADDRGDPVALAGLGWALFAIASSALEDRREAAASLAELRTAARATVAAGDTSPAVTLLRHVLAKRGWLPPPGSTPLQVLAAPPH
jgi:hypothetical protein